MQLVSLILIRWIVIYPVDSAIQRLNNRGLEATTCRTLNVSTLLETIWWKVWARALLSNAKSPLPVDVRRLKTFFFFKLTFNTFRGGLFFRGGGGLLSNVLFTGSWTYNLGGGANKFCQFWYFVPFLYLTCLRFFVSR